MNWYNAHPRKIHFDMHSPKRIKDIGKGFDPKAYGDQVKNSGADAVVVFAKCAYGYTYFDNDFLPMHPGLIRKDLFGDIRTALLDKDIETIAYFSTSSQTIEMETMHPEWIAKDIEGQFIHHEMDSEIAMVCMNSDYWQKAFIPMIRQIVEKYGISGIWMDGYYQLLNKTCYCERCRKDYGHPIPVEKDDPNWRSYYHYVHKKVNHILQTIKNEVIEVNPKCCIGGDWIGSVMWGDVVSHAIDFFSCDVSGRNGSFNTAYASSAWSWRSLPVDVYSERMYWWQDFNTRPVSSVIRDQAITIASGGIWMIGDVIAPYAMKIDSEKSRFYKMVFDSLERLYKETREGRSTAEIAVLLSVEDTRYYGDHWNVQESKHKGMYSAIVEAGFPVHSLFESDLKEHLKNYNVLAISEAQFLSVDAVKAIKAFVAVGGKLLMVGSIPAVLDPECYVDDNVVLDRSDFESLTGTKWFGRYEKDVSFFDVRGTLMSDLWGEGMFKLPESVSGKAVKSGPNGAKVLCHMTKVGSSFQIGASVPGELSEDVAFSVNSYGKGTVMFAAQPLSSNAWENGHVGSYHAIQSLIKALLVEPEYCLIGPSNAQVFLMRGCKDTYTIVPHQQPAQKAAFRQMMRPSMTTGCKLRIKGRIVRAVDSLTGTELASEFLDGYTTLLVPEFTLFATIGVERCKA